MSIYDELKRKDADENLPDNPKAYLNYVLFEDMFNMVDENRYRMVRMNYIPYQLVNSLLKR